ncbi:hypothetical protein LCGC14_2991440, partial [marine sediment metagenome]
MAKGKIDSEAGSKVEQKGQSEAEKVQVDTPKTAEEQVQDQEQAKLEEKIKEGLLKDPEFIKSVVASEGVQSLIQSERDTQVHQLTLPMKQQMEEMER